MALAPDTAKASPSDSRTPEDVLDTDVLADIDRKQAEAEVAAPGRLRDEMAWENALDVDDLRELAARAHRGEHVMLQET